MKTLNLFLIFFFLFSINSYSVTKCEGADPIKWDNCNGTTLLPDIKWEKGRKYIGEFQNGKPNGEGTAIWLSDPDGNKYEGKWKNGKRHGKGTQMYNGFRLVSTWVNDVNKGKGILFFPESHQKHKSLEGYFNQNGLIKGKAVITYADDSKINLEVGENSIITRAGQWYSYKSEDEFEEKKQIYFYSAKIPPNKSLSFPYKNSDPFVGIGCEKRDKKDWCWIYLKFKALNMLGGDIQDGYMDHNVRVKLQSGEIMNLATSVNTGSNTIHFYNDLKINNYLSENTELLIEVNHYGDGKRHYKIDTRGFAEIMDSNFPNNYWLRN